MQTQMKKKNTIFIGIAALVSSNSYINSMAGGGVYVDCYNKVYVAFIWTKLNRIITCTPLTKNYMQNMYIGTVSMSFYLF